jgi:hypothetical protein
LDTCLFTGVSLDSKTRVEHTIPESLGGRIETRRVTSSDFNERWGSLLVAALKAPYASIMNRLGPLLPEAHKTRMVRIDVEGEIPGLILDEDGVVTRDGLEIIARDPKTKRPRVIIGSDEKAIRKILRQAGASDDQITLSYVPANSANYHTSTVPIIWGDIELGALTATLLSFDELLRDRGNRFTRSDEFAPVRDFIRTVVQNGRFTDGNDLHRFSLGLQYEKLPGLIKLRDKSTHPKTPFEHVLFASGDAAARTVDLVWLVLGFDPFGFRIDNWRGSYFTYMIVNGILKDTSVSGLIELPATGVICRPTDRRAFPDRLPAPAKQAAIMDEISQRRRAAWEEAVYLVETTADEFIIGNIKLAGDLKGGTSTLRSLVSHRLRRMYGRKFYDSAFETNVDGLVGTRRPELPSEIAAQTYVADSDGGGVDWQRWLTFYRTCLDDLVAKHGKPGDTSAGNSVVVTDSIDSRELGKPPVPF